jgi:hypothetical protein
MHVFNKFNSYLSRICDEMRIYPGRDTLYLELLNECSVCFRYSLLLRQISPLKSRLRGLRSLGVTFPPHDSSDAGSNPARGTLSCLTRVVNLLHVKEPQAPKEASEQNYRPFPVQSFGRGLAMSWSLIQGALPIVNRSGNWKRGEGPQGL